MLGWRRWLQLVGLVGFTVLAAWPQTPGGGAAPIAALPPGSYAITQISANGFASSLNNYGQVTTSIGNPPAPGLWTPTTPNGTVGNVTRPGFGGPINDRGEIASALADSTAVASLWRPDVPNGTTGKIVPLVVSGGGTAATRSINRLNNYGQVVGYYQDGTNFFWTPSTPNGTVGTMNNDSRFRISLQAINDYGQAVINSSPYGMPLFTPSAPNGATGTFTLLPGLPGELPTAPAAINRSGTILGWSCLGYTGGPLCHGQGFLWTPATANGTSGVVTPIPMPPGFSDMVVVALNATGQVVGNLAQGGPSITPFLFSGGIVYDLSTLGDVMRNGQPFAINDYGQITVAAADGGVYLLTPQATIAAVINDATQAAGPIAPGMLASIMGAGFSDGSLSQCTSNFSIPPVCGGVSVLVNGEAAPVWYTSSTQLRFQAPADVAGATATVQVVRQGGGQTYRSNVFTVAAAPAAPGLYTTGAAGLAEAYGPATTVITAANPARPGDVVTVYGTGLGATKPVVPAGSPAGGQVPLSGPVTATVGGASASVLFAGLAPGFLAGTDEVMLQVPPGLTPGNLPVVVAVGGAASQAGVLLPVGSPSMTISRVTNAASGAAGIESGSWVSVYGSNLSATSRSWQAADFSGLKLPMELDGVRVAINGKAAAVAYISPSQVNVQAPDDGATGAVTVQVTNVYGSATGNATLETYAPGFFSFQAKYVAAVHADGAYVAPEGYFGSGVSSRPAQPGETILLFGTGFGPTTPAVAAGLGVSNPAAVADVSGLRVLVGSAACDVQYAGIVAAGEYQLNVVVPEVGDGDQAIVAEIGGMSTQGGLLIPVRK